MNKLKRSLVCIVSLFLVVINTSCKKETQEPKNDVTFSGKIINNNSDSLMLIGYNSIDSTQRRSIKINKDGAFSETFSSSPTTYYIMDGKSLALRVFLRNGYDLNMTFDAENQIETVKFTGIGADVNNYLIEDAKNISKIGFTLGLDTLSDSDYSRRVMTYYDDRRTDLKNLKFDDTIFIAYKEKSIDDTEAVFLNKRKNNPSKLVGKISPKFKDYCNYNGGTSSLDDFLGKYVYIDLWATWCSPCKKEIPFLEKVEKQYHDKNIVFLSISVDRQKDKAKWERMIKEKNMGGVQLLADKDTQSQFYKDYNISGIPWFIFLDPEGKIISAQAPRPSEGKLIELFTKKGL
ncbi:TlpA disulfide reductase family protein [Wenyingzhuangia sp. 2_MG-2023]|uniref:TlpA family protein disulfide reductase n=1 Tax=Wenyingzhuangia sp. 2_MG-2023 TaxID=3062639 RepID=UPI0026E35D20|nr:TlpA disulfide reductase family protein [Wenyingzhuangia sp. 2_MG-2023]MDO6739015.1 TlpA disulfide reductase family protein [Wenyingzhuangia sp. 2_MG-2023]MDO6803453.1 TlpA disulfide reductase family protein [Wenyingzhuangia sp. 1_MG-2023]